KAREYGDTPVVFVGHDKVPQIAISCTARAPSMLKNLLLTDIAAQNDSAVQPSSQRRVVEFQVLPENEPSFDAASHAFHFEVVSAYASYDITAELKCVPSAAVIVACAFANAPTAPGPTPACTLMAPSRPLGAQSLHDPRPGDGAGCANAFCTPPAD